MPRIAAVICTYNRYDLLPKAIESLRKQTMAQKDFRIIVVDNSPDKQIALRFGERYRGIPNLTYVWEKTPGLSNARNVAAKMCETEFIAYMDDDAIACPVWLDELCKAFDQFGKNTGIVGGRVDPIWDRPRPRWLHDKLLGHVSVVNWGGAARVAGPHEWFAGTNITYRTGLLLEHGGFSTSLGRIGSGASLLSNEEIALSSAIKAANKLLVYAPLAKVDHLVEQKRLSQTWFRKRSAWQAASDFILSPEESVKNSQHQWQPILEYFNKLPPKERSIRGLYWETEDPELFLEQLGVIYMSTTASLAGFEYAER